MFIKKKKLSYRIKNIIIGTPNTAKTHTTSIPPTMKWWLSDDAELNVVALSASTVVEQKYKISIKTYVCKHLNLGFIC